MSSNSTTTYAPGTPCWIDLGSPDLAAAARFYSELFGWEAQDMGEQMGHYTFFRQGGRTVGAAGPLMSPQQPVAWQTYICSEDAAATAKAVREAGGQVLMEPMTVMNQGTLAVFADPAGAAFGIWQPRDFKGADLVNAANSLCWNELHTRNLEGAKGFYGRVFGWGAKSNDMPGHGEYVEWQNDGRTVAGSMAIGPQMPAQMPSHWLVYFAVADTDATASKAQELGATAMVPPTDIPQGRFALLNDPQGAAFGIIKMAGMAQG
jgi:predicted enzyme related to lactoylglutathione lyase